MDHFYTLVLLSIGIMIFGTQTSIALAKNYFISQNHRFLWLFGSSFVMGLSVWSMHFTAMFSYHDILFYDGKYILFSLLSSIVITYGSFLLFFQGALFKGKLLLSGILFGFGIFLTHYIGIGSVMGVKANVDPVHMGFSLVYKFSVTVLLAYYSNYLRRHKPAKLFKRWLSYLLIGTSITSIHYISMLGLTFIRVKIEDSSFSIGEGTLLSWVILGNLITIALASIVAYIDKSETQKRVAEKQLMFQTLFENNQDAVIIVDRWGNIIDTNEQGNAELEEIRQNDKELYDIIHPADAELVRNSFRKSLKGTITSFRVRIQNHQNGYSTFKVRSIPLGFGAQTDGVYFIVKDISDQVQLRKELLESNRKMEAFFESTVDAINIFSMDKTLIYVNRGFEQMFGWKEEEVLGNKAPYLTPAMDDERQIWFEHLVEGEHVENIGIPVLKKDGTFLETDITLSPLKDEYDQVFAFAAIIRDVTLQKSTARQLREKEEKYSLIAEYSVDLIRIVELNGSVSYYSPSHSTVLGYSADELQTMNYEQLIKEEDRGILEYKFRRCLLTKESIKVEYRCLHKNGDHLWFESHRIPVLNASGEISHFIVVSRDISERKKYEASLQNQAYMDSLTGIPNRSFFKKELAKTIKKAKLHDRQFAIAYIDADRFKWINDTYGHDVGDAFLKGIADRIKNCIREGDMIARVGGDEFVLILDDLFSRQEAAGLANKLLQAFRQPILVNEKEIVSSISIGLSYFPEDGEDGDVLVARADQALYACKEKGRNRYSFFTDSMAREVEKRLQLEEIVRTAIPNGHFSLVYQPQINIQTGELAGLEALLRLSHPMLGNVSPAEFIPVCESSGMINDVTQWVLNEAFKQQKKWKDLGHGEIPIAINISPTNLLDPDFLEKTWDLVHLYHSDPKKIELEVTEEVFMHDAELVLKVLHKLRRIGFKITLDDFGSGYSSLKYLKEIPCTKVKIDRSFFKDIPNGEKDKSVFEGILFLLQQLKEEIVCEGIEHQEQYDYLKAKGCQIIQGYYFSKPLAPAEIKAAFLLGQQENNEEESSCAS